REPPGRLPDLRATSCPALTRSPRTSVSYWATEASTSAISRPAGVDRSNPSFKLTGLTMRSRRSSKRAVNPFAVRPNRSIRQQTAAETCPFRMAPSNLAHFVILLLLIFITSACIGQVPDAEKTTARVSAYLNKLEAVGFTGSVLVEI